MLLTLLLLLLSMIHDQFSAIGRGRRRMFDEMIILLLLLMFMVMFTLPVSCSSEMQVHELLTCFKATTISALQM